MFCFGLQWIARFINTNGSHFNTQVGPFWEKLCPRSKCFPRPTGLDGTQDLRHSFSQYGPPSQWITYIFYTLIKVFYISLSSQPCTNEHHSWKPRIEWVLGQMESPSNSGSQRSHIRIQRVLQNFQTAVLLLSGQHFKNQQHKYGTSNFAEYSNWSTLHNFSGCFHVCWNRTKVIPCL